MLVNKIEIYVDITLKFFENIFRWRTSNEIKKSTNYCKQLRQEESDEDWESISDWMKSNKKIKQTKQGVQNVFISIGLATILAVMSEVAILKQNVNEAMLFVTLSYILFVSAGYILWEGNWNEKSIHR